MDQTEMLEEGGYGNGNGDGSQGEKDALLDEELEKGSSPLTARDKRALGLLIALCTSILYNSMRSAQADSWLLLPVLP